MSCLNPWDVQSKRVLTIDSIADSLYAGMGEGGGKIWILVKVNELSKKDRPTNGKFTSR